MTDTLLFLILALLLVSVIGQGLALILVARTLNLINQRLRHLETEARII